MSIFIYLKLSTVCSIIQKVFTHRWPHKERNNNLYHHEEKKMRRHFMLVIINIIREKFYILLLNILGFVRHFFLFLSFFFSSSSPAFLMVNVIYEDDYFILWKFISNITFQSVNFVQQFKGCLIDERLINYMVNI